MGEITNQPIKQPSTDSQTGQIAEDPSTESVSSQAVGDASVSNAEMTEGGIPVSGGSEKVHSHRFELFKKYTERFFHTVVLVLSLLLIIYISYDTFYGIPFLSNHKYMLFQFWVCMIFLLDFFVELLLADNRKQYLKRMWFFFLISIPYLNIINQYDFHFSERVLYYLRFVPLIRGAYSLSLVIGFVSKNKAVSLLSQYTAILASLVYILAMIFYYQEFGPNPNVKSFWDALYWAAMNMTTVGCYFAAVTTVGKIISVILPILGMMMLPLFTVYVTDHVKRFNMRNNK